MEQKTRRDFLSQVGTMMLVAGAGAEAAADLGVRPASAEEGQDAIRFGRLEPLVCFLQETPTDKLLPGLVERLNRGTKLRDLVAAGALANARSFGGEHYRGFHAFMALGPAYQMARELDSRHRPLPVLKVLYRNSTLLQEAGGRRSEKLHPVTPADLPNRADGAALLQQANRSGDMQRSEAIFAALMDGSTKDALNDLLYRIEDRGDVHTTVLVWRSWEMLDLAGREFAHTLLRQSVRHCITEPAEVPSADRIPDLLERYHLMAGPQGRRRAEDRWIEEQSEALIGSTPEGAASLTAAALEEGYHPEEVGEAISVASNLLVLRQVANWEKGLGTRVHGDSPGVHASDATSAWRNMARIAAPRHRAAGLLIASANLAASHRWSDDVRYRAHDRKPWPLPEHLEAVAEVRPEALLQELEGAIRDRDQVRACALVHRYGTLPLPEGPVFETLLKYAISEDGRLHAEKYYYTVREEFGRTRPVFRRRQLTALARVTASAYGTTETDEAGDFRAPGYDQARELLGL